MSHNLQEDIEHYKASDEHLSSQVHEHNDKVFAKKVEIDELKEARSRLGLWNKIKTYRSFKQAVGAIEKEQSSIRSTINGFSRDRTRIKSQLVNKHISQVLSQSSELDMIRRLQCQLNDAERIHQSNQRLVDSGNDVLRELDEAEDAVDSAETMEMLDLVTNSSAISMLSTMENSEVEEEVDDAKRAIRSFARALGEHRDLVQDLEHSTTLEFIDLGMDFMGMNDSFDFGSIISLFNLSKTGDQISTAICRVKSFMPDLERAALNSNNECARIKRELWDLKQDECKPLLQTFLRSNVEIYPVDFEKMVAAQTV
ncbi:hypothetical protein LCS82_08110 [Vibrio harveyi]|uniref:hypothetical protein n=1 Tax=Vibrio harveyi TaxID=669 RepID=UPI003BB7ED19